MFADIFQDWRPLTCASLAQKASDALSPGGRIFLLEALTDDDRPPAWLSASYNVLMML